MVQAWRRNVLFAALLVVVAAASLEAAQEATEHASLLVGDTEQQALAALLDEHRKAHRPHHEIDAVDLTIPSLPQLPALVEKDDKVAVVTQAGTRATTDQRQRLAVQTAQQKQQLRTQQGQTVKSQSKAKLFFRRRRRRRGFFFRRRRRRRRKRKPRKRKVIRQKHWKAYKGDDRCIMCQYLVGRMDLAIKSAGLMPFGEARPNRNDRRKPEDGSFLQVDTALLTQTSAQTKAATSVSASQWPYPPMIPNGAPNYMAKGPYAAPIPSYKNPFWIPQGALPMDMKRPEYDQYYEGLEMQLFINMRHVTRLLMDNVCESAMPNQYYSHCRAVLKNERPILNLIGRQFKVQDICVNIAMCTRRSYIYKMKHTPKPPRRSPLLGMRPLTKGKKGKLVPGRFKGKFPPFKNCRYHVKGKDTFKKSCT